MKSVSNQNTIRDVAKQAGVSAATVSRVLNGHAGVREPARQAVERVVAELGFVPNHSARRLSLGRTFTVGVVLPHFTQPSFVERLKGIDAVLSRSHYDMSVANIEDVTARDRVFAQLARSERVDGVIVITVPPGPAQIRAFNEAGIPIVLVDTRHPEIPSIFEDSVAGSKLATRHLLELGHRRIAFLSDMFEDPFGGPSRGCVRYRGHCAALKAAGIAVDEGLLRIGANYRQDAFKMATELMQLPHRPSAIFAFSDVHAIGALQAARALGLHVPGDISIMGYDDIDMAEAVGLTTVRQSLLESGRLGAELLLAELGEPGKSGNSQRELQVQLVARSSTGPAPSQSANGHRARRKGVPV